MLNEELVAWRLADGSVGLLQEHCSHRGSSLVYARSDGDCLRCVYHGWIDDVGGNVLDTPAEPARSVIKDKVKHPSYGTHEAAGVIWAYLGPKDKQPLLPNYRFTEAPAENVYVTKVMMTVEVLPSVLARSAPSCGSIMKMGSGYMGTPSPNCFDCWCMLTTVLSALLRATHMGAWECMASVASGRALRTSV
jgi:nitrite reductase/ring-hydroxylating ferredoxin subunit